MAVRHASRFDLEAIVACDSNARGDPSRQAFLKRRVNDGECWIAEDHGRVIGFVVLDCTFYGHGFVSLLVVHEDFRRRGVGRALLEHALSICSTPKLFTSTNESNAPMRALLTALGFEPSGVIRNLDPGDPELVFFRGRHGAPA